jgi:hypothetical protein
MTALQVQRMQLSRLRGGLRRASAQAAFANARRRLPKAAFMLSVSCPTASLLKGDAALT